MNYNTGNTHDYRRNEELDRTHKTADGKVRGDRFTVKRLGNYYGKEAVFGRKWMKKRNEWSKGDVFIEYYHADKGDTFND